MKNWTAHSLALEKSGPPLLCFAGLGFASLHCALPCLALLRLLCCAALGSAWLGYAKLCYALPGFASLESLH
jgi:hypothetical protein